jgi:hypothetical protein
MQMLYQYLTGPQFEHRVQAIVENFGNMLDDLEKEKKVQEKVWAKRDLAIGQRLATEIEREGDEGLIRG